MTDMILYMLEADSYDNYSTPEVFLNRETAEAAKLIREEYSHQKYSIYEFQPKTRVPQIHQWWRASAWVSTLSPLEIRSYLHKELRYSDPKPFESDVRETVQQFPNPGYVKDTPNARVPNTPGGRWIEVPAVSSFATAATEEEAIHQATFLLQEHCVKISFPGFPA